ncbi:hypothetical protein X749_31555 [Mesorhizobium sp. LNJC391B00]|nr:hypothetical protein X749_31555 [Mesorhizobium sp. LNJC391B00]
MKFYKIEDWDPPLYQRWSAQYELHVDLVCDLACDLMLLRALIVPRHGLFDRHRRDELGLRLHLRPGQSCQRLVNLSLAALPSADVPAVLLSSPIVPLDATPTVFALKMRREKLVEWGHKSTHGSSAITEETWEPWCRRARRYGEMTAIDDPTHSRRWA